MLRGALLAGLLGVSLGATPALAQDWATAEVCTVDAPYISDAAFAPAELLALEAEAEGILNANGKFWRITSPRGAVSHIWGTYHSSDPSILVLPDPVTDTIEAARVVAVEVDYRLESREAYRRSLDMEGRFKEASDPFAFTPGDGTIAGLPLEVSLWIRDRALELGWSEDIDLILSLPGIAEVLLSDPCEDFTNGVLPIQDDYILLLGRLAGADILSLETHDELIEDLADDEDTARAIVATYAAYLKPMATNAERAASFALYQQGRLGVLEAWDYAFQREVYGAAGAEYLDLTDAYLLDLRNIRFVERLESDIGLGGVFIAVGSAHIPGENGLVALLRDKGYKVERIPLPGEVP